MTQQIQNRWLIYVLVISNLLFISLYVVLCYYNRIAIDDFHFLNNMQKYGLFEGTYLEWDTFNTRWLSVLLNHTVHKLHISTGLGLFLFGIMNLILFAWAIKVIIGTINLRWLKIRLDMWVLWNIAVFGITIIFYSTFKINETWFWLCSSCSVLVSMIALTAGINWLIKDRVGVAGSIVASVCFIYIGGASGPLALTVLLIIMGLLVSKRIKPLQTFGGLVPSPRLLMAFMLCLISFVILYVGEGNRIREQLFPEISVWQAILLNAKTTAMIVLLRIPYILPFAIVGVLSVTYLRKNFIGRQGKPSLKTILIVTGVYFALIYCYQLPITYKTSDIAAYRTLFPISVLTIIYLGLLVWWASYFVAGKTTYVFTMCSLSCCLIYNGFNLINSSSVVAQYARAYDYRMLILENSAENAHILLSRLPESGFLMSAEIQADTSHFSNLLLKEAYSLKNSSGLRK